MDYNVQICPFCGNTHEAKIVDWKVSNGQKPSPVIVVEVTCLDDDRPVKILLEKWNTRTTVTESNYHPFTIVTRRSL